MSADKIVVHLNDKRLARTFETFYDDVYEAGAASVQKELESTRAELAAEREKCMLIAQDLKWENQLSLKLQESKAELESTRAELAAERAKPRVGVAWALKHKYKDEFWLFSSGCKYLYETKEAANSHLNRAMSGTIWEPVPYPISDGADELKAAIEAKEKAEAELAALKAAPAEVPPLDKWRVLATARAATYRMSAVEPSTLGVVCDIVNELIVRIQTIGRQTSASPYSIKD